MSFLDLKKMERDGQKFRLTKSKTYNMQHKKKKSELSVHSVILNTRQQKRTQDLYVMNFVSFNSVLKSALAVIYLSLM